MYTLECNLLRRHRSHIAKCVLRQECAELRMWAQSTAPRMEITLTHVSVRVASHTRNSQSPCKPCPESAQGASFASKANLFCATFFSLKFSATHVRYAHIILLYISIFLLYVTYGTSIYKTCPFSLHWEVTQGTQVCRESKRPHPAAVRAADEAIG